jgi:hypothetical protein
MFFDFFAPRGFGRTRLCAAVVFAGALLATLTPAGVAEAFPNGGGNRGYLFVVDGPNGRFAWFFQNSVSLSDIAKAIVVGGVDYGAPIDNLKAALSAEELRRSISGLGPPTPPSPACGCRFSRPRRTCPFIGTGCTARSTPACRDRTPTRTLRSSSRRLRCS